MFKEGIALWGEDTLQGGKDSSDSVLPGRIRLLNLKIGPNQASTPPSKWS